MKKHSIIAQVTGYDLDKGLVAVRSRVVSNGKPFWVSINSTRKKYDRKYQGFNGNQIDNFMQQEIPAGKSLILENVLLPDSEIDSSAVYPVNWIKTVHENPNKTRQGIITLQGNFSYTKKTKDQPRKKRASVMNAAIWADKAVSSKNENRLSELYHRLNQGRAYSDDVLAHKNAGKQLPVALMPGFMLRAVVNNVVVKTSLPFALKPKNDSVRGSVFVPYSGKDLLVQIDQFSDGLVNQYGADFDVEVMPFDRYVVGKRIRANESLSSIYENYCTICANTSPEVTPPPTYTGNMLAGKGVIVISPGNVRGIGAENDFVEQILLPHEHKNHISDHVLSSEGNKTKLVDGIFLYSHSGEVIEGKKIHSIKELERSMNNQDYGHFSKQAVTPSNEARPIKTQHQGFTPKVYKKTNEAPVTTEDAIDTAMQRFTPC